MQAITLDTRTVDDELVRSIEAKTGHSLADLLREFLTSTRHQVD